MIAPWASAYVGLPFAELGRDRSGLDCWGLVRLVLREQFGFDLPSFADAYDSTLDSRTIGAIASAEKLRWQAVPHGQERAGDVIMLRVNGFSGHVGVVIGGGLMLHVLRGADSGIEPYAGIRWQSKIMGFYRYHGAGA